MNFESMFLFLDMSEYGRILPNQVLTCGRSSSLKILDCIQNGAFGSLYSGSYEIVDRTDGQVRREPVCFI